MVSHLDITTLFCAVDDFCQSFDKDAAGQIMLPSMIKSCSGMLWGEEGAIIESVNDQLKNICQIENSRHRSFLNFLVNLLAGLIAYTYRETKPALALSFKGLPPLPSACF